MDLSQEQNKLIDRVATENGFCDYKVISTPGSSKGDNFLGILTALTIKSDDKTLELILKSAHTNEAFRKAASLGEVYEREMYLYEHIFGEFKKFQEANNISNPFNSTARTYGFSAENGHECFIMENLKSAGYQMWNKKVPMNSDHIEAVLKEYAKFHAVSLAMRTKCPKLFDEFSENISKNVFETNDMMASDEKLDAFIKSVMANGYEAVKDDAALTECLQKVESGVTKLFHEDMKNPEYRLVITHGDCWCNNFLFKYKDPKDPKTPSSLRILDWQISSVASPALDICYFFLAHSSQQILADYKTYLKIYHDTLSAQLRNFNCDPEEVFPYSLLENHVQKFMIFGLYMGLMIFKVMVCDSDEVPDLDERSEKHDDIVEIMGFKMKNFEEYKKRVVNVVTFLNNNNFI